MSPERKQICDHIEVSLKEYFDTKFTALEKATELARSEMERRLEGLNELRTQVVQDRGQFVSREFYEAKNNMLQSELNQVKNSVSRFAITAGVVVTLLQIVEPIAFYFLFHK